jgi:hypothetical protein
MRKLDNKIEKFKKNLYLIKQYPKPKYKYCSLKINQFKSEEEKLPYEIAFMKSVIATYKNRKEGAMKMVMLIFTL